MLSCNWNTKVITVPKSDLTLVGGTRYNITVLYWFQLLRELNGSVEGMAETIGFPLYRNVAPTSSTPRIVDVINGYTVQIEDGLYSLEFINGNTNFRDVEIKNQVSVGTNNTTGFIDPKFLEFSLFNGGVTVDAVNGTTNLSGELVGSPSNPVKLLSDAYDIVVSRNLPKKVYVVGDITISDEAAWIGFTFEGESALKSIIEVDDIADVFNCEFYNCTVTGVLDGASQIEKSVVSGLDFVDGFIFRCAIGALPIQLGTFTTANIWSCYSTVAGEDTPVIDMNGAGILGMRDYSGGIRLENYNGAGSHTIELARGQCILDSATITSGTFVVRGIGKLIDESGNRIESGIWNGSVNIINELIEKATIQKVLDILEGDVIPTPAEFSILHRVSKSILVQKTASEVGGLTQLTE